MIDRVFLYYNGLFMMDDFSKIAKIEKDQKVWKDRNKFFMQG